MKIAVQLKPRGVIPRDQSVGVRMRRLEPPTVIETIIREEAPVEPPAVDPLPAGVDSWYDAPNDAVIPFRAIDREVCPNTSNVGFGLDDDVDFEGDYVSGGRSAWWQITVPDDVTDAELTADTWLTVPAPTSSAVPADGDPDTILELLRTDEAPPLGALPTAETDFSTLSVVAFSDDDPDPDGVNPNLSKIVWPLEAGKVYWLRVALSSEAAVGTFYDTLYRLRLSLTFTPAP